MCHYYWEGGKPQCISYGRERNNPSSLGSPICLLGCPPEKITLNKRVKTCYPSTSAYFWEKRKTKVYYLATVVRRELNDTVRSLDNTTSPPAATTATVTAAPTTTATAISTTRVAQRIQQSVFFVHPTSLRKNSSNMLMLVPMMHHHS